MDREWTVQDRMKLYNAEKRWTELLQQYRKLEIQIQDLHKHFRTTLSGDERSLSGKFIQASLAEKRITKSFIEEKEEELKPLWERRSKYG